MFAIIQGLIHFDIRLLLADPLLAAPMQVQAEADESYGGILSSQLSSSVNGSEYLNASFAGMLLHAQPGSYDIMFSLINYQVGCHITCFATVTAVAACQPH